MDWIYRFCFFCFEDDDLPLLITTVKQFLIAWGKKKENVQKMQQKQSGGDEAPSQKWVSLPGHLVCTRNLCQEQSSVEESQNTRMVWAGRNLEDHPVLPTCCGQRHLPLSQATARPIQPGLKNIYSAKGKWGNNKVNKRKLKIKIKLKLKI